MTDPMPVFLIHFGAACYMTGVIWFVQLIHYRFLNEIPPGNFASYHQRYTKIMGYVVGSGMCIEIISGILLSVLFIEHNVIPIHLNMGLLIVIWVSTFAVQVPCHMKLNKGYDTDTHRKLVKFNWIRTIAWTARVLILGDFLIL